MINFFTNDKILKFALFPLSALFLAAAAAISLTLNNSTAGTAVFICAFMAFITALAFFLFWRENLCASLVRLTLTALPFYVSLLIRLAFFDYITLDYVNFLEPWCTFFAENGGFSALKSPVGNYNIPYLTLLASFSYIPVHNLYLIKLFSVLFDFLLAFSVLKLISIKTENAMPQCIGFIVTMFLPTVLLNGSLWGQCDSIYAAFALLSLYLALCGRPCLSVISIAISFSFKLQAVFIMPVFIILLIAKKISVQHLLLFPLTYLAAVSPAILAGRPIIDTLTIYFSELGTVGSALNYNSPSVFSLFRNVSDPGLAGKLGILAAFTLCTAVIFTAVIRRYNLKSKAVIYAALTLSAGIPMLLPHMHDRYFFITEALIIVPAVMNPAFIPAAALISFASLLGYHAYLRGYYLLTMNYGFIALFIAFAIVFSFYIRSLFAPPMDTVSEILDDYTL